MSDYAGYVEDELFDPVGVEIVPDPVHRYLALGPTPASLRSYLLNSDHPYRTMDVWTSSVLFDTLPPPVVSQNSPHPIWGPNANPDANAPDYVSRGHHGGDFAMSHAVLPAGGWFGSGDDLGVFIRDLAQIGSTMSIATADQLWDPAVTIPADTLGSCWEYGRGFYVRGNWIAMAGGTDGSMATVLHNWQQDFTVVMLTNVWGNGLSEFVNPLLDGALGTVEFACVDDSRFPEDECEVGCND